MGLMRRWTIRGELLSVEGSIHVRYMPPTMIEMYRTMFGISDGLVAHSESTNCPNAAPRGLAKLARAVALVRPLSENHRSL